MPNCVKRLILYRLLLGKPQSIVMTLLMRELGLVRKPK